LRLEVRGKRAEGSRLKAEKIEGVKMRR